MKKLLSLLLVGSALLISACATPQAASTGSVSSDDASAADEIITIEYWNINTETFGGPQVDALIESFQAENPNVVIESRPQAGYPEVVQGAETAIAGGNPPDIIQVGYPYLNYVGNNLPYQAIGMLAETHGGEDYLAQFPQNILDIPVVNGEQIGMAYSLSNALIFYNADLFVEAGLDPESPPTTFAEWGEVAEAFSALGVATLNFAYSEDNWTIENLMGSNGGDFLACVDGEYQAAFTSPEAVEALDFWAATVTDGYGLNVSWNEGRQAFLAGEAVTYTSSIAGRAGLQRDAEFDLRAVAYPQFGEKPTRLPGGGNMLVIFSEDPARQEAAWKFVQHLTSAEGFTEWTKGTGYVPLIPGLTEDPNYLADFVAENPIQQIAVDQLENVITWTSFPGENGLAAGRALFEATESVLSGETNAEEALAAAADEVNRLISGQTCGG